jgi:RNA polymerase sigma-70 factor (ECF subfamily)
MAQMLASQPVTDPLAEALQRAQEGNPDAFGDLVRAHERMVYSLALHMVWDPARAEELAQDVFLQLFRQLADIDSPSHLRHWLRRVTSHRAIDALRQRASRRTLGLDDVPEPAAPRYDPDPWIGRLVRQLVAALPTRARAVVVLRYQEELDLAEIAKVLDMPVNTVKSHLRRSLAVLRGRASQRVEART